MTGNPCAEFFAQHWNDPNYVTKLPPANECVAWELLSAAPNHSPGPVSDCETVRRRIINPTHIDDLGVPTPACFNDAWNKGLSLDRDFRPEEASRDDAVSWVNAFNRNNSGLPRKSFQGLAVATVADLRGLTISGSRAFVVFDTALPSNTAHADLCALGSSTKLERKDLRTTLWSFFNKSLGIT